MLGVTVTASCLLIRVGGNAHGVFLHTAAEQHVIVILFTRSGDDDLVL